jgi:hypothetical protein
MENIIPPVPVEILMSELTQDRFLRKTNKGNNEIYIFSDHDSPNLMLETARLREVTFRHSGGGTGKEIDMDKYDQGENGFKQLIVWNPESQDIVGGYRFIDCKNLRIGPDGQVQTPTAKLFHYSEKFIRDYIPYTIELGRSFVQPAYQPTSNMRKGMYSLDNLWDGLGSLITLYPESRYFFGKVTMYSHFDVYARDLILSFINKYFRDDEQLVTPHVSLPITTPKEKIDAILSGSNYHDDYKNLNREVRHRNENIPPLVDAYMNLSSTMKSFGTAFNASFGQVEETGIIVTMRDIYPEKSDRHVKTFVPGGKPVHLS